MTNQEFEAKLMYLQKQVRDMRGIARWVHPTPVSWNAETMELTMVYQPDPDMGNPIGGLHGGIIATMFDNGLGALAISFAEGAFTPTISMNLEYLRPAPVDAPVYLHASIVKLGRNMIHLRGELLEAPDSRKPYAAATAIFAIHKTAKL